MGKVVVWYIIGVNVLAYFVYWWDKKRAEKGRKRISERELLIWAAAGGSLGAFFSMRKFRHKTQKKNFRYAFWGIVAVQIALLWFFIRPPS